MVFQFIAVGALIAYMLYLIYYHVLPMSYFRFLLFRAIKRGGCIGIQSWDGKITVRYMKDGQECRYTRPIDEDMPTRFLTSAACQTLKSLLSDIENGVV